MAKTEQDIRLEILNTLLTTPHRDLAQAWPVHQAMADQDPRFYARLAAWYADHGDVRDHKELFVIRLVLSDFDGHREVGLALLRALPPYELVRVIDFIHGRQSTRTVRVAAKSQRRQQARRLFGTAPAAQPVEEARFEKRVERFGLFRNVPRSVKTEVTRYLREREAQPDWFDSTALVARKALKRLYAVLHVQPGDRAQKILFEKDPPADSRLFALRELTQATTPAEQARAIVEQRIPYRVATTVIKALTPTVLLALVERMSPQEVINNLGSLKRRGALDNPDIKALIEARLAEAKTATRVSAFKSEEAAKAVGLPEDVQRQLAEIADAQVKAKGRITRPTALLVDKSASMEQAIELGKRIGAMVSAICQERLYVYAFDTLAHEITAQGTDMAAWERAFRGITAAGATSCGVALNVMRRKNQHVEQIIMVTDEGENTLPYFTSELALYRAAFKADPGICLVRTPGGSSLLEQQCRAAGQMVDVFQFSGDYYALPNLIPMLTRPSKLELLLEIMEYPLPERRAVAV
jgi:hypothetical protein